MTVAEFIAWLQTQDQGATVKVMVQERASTWESYGPCNEVPFRPELADYTDCREDWAKGKPYEGERTLVLGEKW